METGRNTQNTDDAGSVDVAGGAEVRLVEKEGSKARKPKTEGAKRKAGSAEAKPGATTSGKSTAGTRAKVSRTAIPAKPAVRTGLERKSKKDQLLALIAKPNGARVSVIVERLGWQPHTVRAALSGLRKQGIAIVASKAPKTGETVYAIVTRTDEEGTRSESARSERAAS